MSPREREGRAGLGDSKRRWRGERHLEARCGERLGVGEVKMRSERTLRTTRPRPQVAQGQLGVPLEAQVSPVSWSSFHLFSRKYIPSAL